MPEFGANRAKPFVPGAECLPEEKDEEEEGEFESDDGGSDDSDDDGSDGWVNMPSSGGNEMDQFSCY